MFVQPLYCGVLFDQGMLLNRRKDDYEDLKGVDEKVTTTSQFMPIKYTDILRTVKIDKEIRRKKSMYFLFLSKI